MQLIFHHLWYGVVWSEIQNGIVVIVTELMFFECPQQDDQVSPNKLLLILIISYVMMLQLLVTMQNISVHPL